MNNWKIILATVVIFGAGAVMGGLLVRQTAAQPRPARVRPAATQPPGWLPPTPEFPRRPTPELQRSLEQRRLEFMLHASRTLNLTAEQRQRIERLLGESQERIRTMWEQIAPQMRKELADAREKVRQELTPAQRKIFDEMLKRQQTRRGDEAPPTGRQPREGRRSGEPRDGPAAEQPPGPLPPSRDR